METRLIKFNDVTAQQWDLWMRQFDGAHHYHSWHTLNHVTQLEGLRENCSFVLVDDQGEPRALCPLAISTNDNSTDVSLSFRHFPCGNPLVRARNASDRRRMLDNIFTIILGIAQDAGAKKILMVTDPLTVSVFKGQKLTQQNTFELLRYNMFYSVENLLVVDLHHDSDYLESQVSKYHWRHILRGKKKGIEISAYSHTENASSMRSIFQQMQREHFKAAGRATRPQATWDTMYTMLEDGNATLFVARVKDDPVSYLFCYQFEKALALGVSQVNADQYEKELSPRHLLEWEAMLYYKKNGFSFYELGERFFGPQLLHPATEKEVSISLFKERFGGMMLPRVMWTGYFDSTYMREDIHRRVDQFFSSAPAICSVPTS